MTDLTLAEEETRNAHDGHGGPMPEQDAELPEITSEDAWVLTYLARIPKQERRKELEEYKSFLSDYAKSVAFLLAGIESSLPFSPSHNARMDARRLDRKYRVKTIS